MTKTAMNMVLLKYNLSLKEISVRTRTNEVKKEYIINCVLPLLSKLLYLSTIIMYINNCMTPNTIKNIKPR